MSKTWKALLFWPRAYLYAAALVLLALLTIALDINDIVQGQVNFNRHIPFFPYPLVLGFFASLCIFLHKRYPLSRD